MLDPLKDVLCGIGGVYLVIHIARVLGSIVSSIRHRPQPNGQVRCTATP